jgi:hypothetical protein
MARNELGSRVYIFVFESSWEALIVPLNEHVREAVIPASNRASPVRSSLRTPAEHTYTQILKGPSRNDQRVNRLGSKSTRGLAKKADVRSTAERIDSTSRQKADAIGGAAAYSHAGLISINSHLAAATKKIRQTPGLCSAPLNRQNLNLVCCPVPLFEQRR